MLSGARFTLHCLAEGELLLRNPRVTCGYYQTLAAGQPPAVAASKCIKLRSSRCLSRFQLADQCFALHLLRLNPFSQSRQTGVKAQEVIPMNRKQLNGINCADREVPRLAAEDGGFSEEIAWSNAPNDGVALGRVREDRLDLSLGNDKNMLGRVALVEDELAWFEL